MRTSKLVHKLRYIQRTTRGTISLVPGHSHVFNVIITRRKRGSGLGTRLGYNDNFHLGDGYLCVHVLKFDNSWLSDICLGSKVGLLYHSHPWKKSTACYLNYGFVW